LEKAAILEGKGFNCPKTKDFKDAFVVVPDSFGRYLLNFQFPGLPRDASSINVIRRKDAKETIECALRELPPGRRLIGICLIFSAIFRFASQFSRHHPAVSLEPRQKTLKIQ
jgi:hypothetical protein